MVRSAAAMRLVNSSCSSCSSASVAGCRPAADWSWRSVLFSFCRAPLMTVNVATLPSSWRILHHGSKGVRHQSAGNAGCSSVERQPHTRVMASR